MMTTYMDAASARSLGSLQVYPCAHMSTLVLICLPLCSYVYPCAHMSTLVLICPIDFMSEFCSDCSTVQSEKQNVFLDLCEVYTGMQTHRLDLGLLSLSKAASATVRVMQLPW